ncbi:riboflavin synthase [Wenzhouxiangella sp. AB-CW3]|uniref:riboflavin synthase n=1 Tax=Wenzhouxiangella sp. AB-CW3 TaxID=2771012 RepID=UPI00168B2461|nr:riboflavin synthase [Wenzhouxiangella sp. AB-CW3]QOC23411.1 riboflavin synthase [Wenzhouxiangella sp. AB-CW3]
MFTGIVQAQGRVSARVQRGGGCRMRIDCAELQPHRWHEGDSVAVAGCCLTVLDLDEDGFSADLSAETLTRTSLGQLREGDPVNLEPALAAGDRLGGHLVTGHVDGLAEVVSIQPSGESRIFRFRVPGDLARFVAEKGSVTLDGVSLTVNAVDDDAFEVNLIPHTLKVTTLGRLDAGAVVNLEVDLVARYLDRLVEMRGKA